MDKSRIEPTPVHLRFKAMTFHAIDPNTAPPEAKTLLEAVKAKLGVAPNMMRVMAANPAVLRGYLAFAGALGAAPLGTRFHTKIALIVAEANGCNYCLA